MTLFADLPPAPIDPILASFQDFMADARPEKANLGVGMYYDDTGRIPLMRAVAEAERRVVAAGTPWGYMMGEGLPGLRAGATRLVLGDTLAERLGPKVAAVQTLGGTGALRHGADILARLSPGGTIASSTPTWGNHHSIFAAAGLTNAGYPYYDRATGGLDWPGMRDALRALPAGTAVLLHACCHNPTGVDPTPEQWREIVDILAARGLVPFLDLAYGGFGEGLEADMAPVRMVAEAGLPALVAVSFSKSFSLYGERVGVLLALTGSAGEAAKVVEMCKSNARLAYSTPPTHGALLVATILSDAGLRAEWAKELEEMRLRIVAMREGLLARVGGNAPARDFSFLTRQKGLFTYSGLGAAEMARLRDEFAVHAVPDGRLCMAALNPGNLDRVAVALRGVAGAP